MKCSSCIYHDECLAKFGKLKPTGTCYSNVKIRRGPEDDDPYDDDLYDDDLYDPGDDHNDLGCK